MKMPTKRGPGRRQKLKYAKTASGFQLERIETMPHPSNRAVSVRTRVSPKPTISSGRLAITLTFTAPPPSGV